MLGFYNHNQFHNHSIYYIPKTKVQQEFNVI